MLVSWESLPMLSINAPLRDMKIEVKGNECWTSAYWKSNTCLKFSEESIHACNIVFCDLPNSWEYDISTLCCPHFLAIMMPTRSLKNSPGTHLVQSVDLHWKEGLWGPCWSKRHQTGSKQIAGKAEWLHSPAVYWRQTVQMGNTMRKSKLCDHLRFESILFKVLEGWNCKTRKRFL